MSDWDAIIVGGGAAGVGAARTLHDAGYKVLIVEAMDRLGGRAHTVARSGMALDLGCGWLHSAERNPWRAIAEAGGVPVDRSRASWGEQWRNLGFPPEDRRAARKAFEAFNQRLYDDPPASDLAADALVPGCEWNGYLDALSGYINGAGLGRLSVADYLAYNEAASDHNWRLPHGYGTLVAGYAGQVPVRLATPVTAIDRHGSDLRIETLRGTLTAEAAIVTVSTNVLASGAIRFRPALDDALHAASSLPLGLADKLFLSIEGPHDIPPDAHLIGNPRDAATGTYSLSPFGRPVIEAFFGGRGASALEAEGLDGAAQFAIEELANLLGSDWRKRLRLIAGSAWAREDHVLGSYSHALPGKASARATLATPIDERIRFAGEACHRSDFSTAHGAHETGVAAAEAILRRPI